MKPLLCVGLMVSSVPSRKTSRQRGLLGPRSRAKATSISPSAAQDFMELDLRQEINCQMALWLPGKFHSTRCTSLPPNGWDGLHFFGGV